MVRTMDDRTIGSPGKYNNAKSAITLSDGIYCGGLVAARSRPPGDQVYYRRGEVSARLRKVDRSKLQLVSRGFHWISELLHDR